MSNLFLRVGSEHLRNNRQSVINLILLVKVKEALNIYTYVSVISIDEGSVPLPIGVSDDHVQVPQFADSKDLGLLVHPLSAGQQLGQSVPNVLRQLLGL